MVRVDDEASLFGRWEAFQARAVWGHAAPGARDRGVVDDALAEFPAVTALEALEANATLVARLTGQRWMVMMAAREAGASWSQIGEALGMTKQGAQDWYRRKIADQDQYLGARHDAARARAALDGAAAATPNEPGGVDEDVPSSPAGQAPGRWFRITPAAAALERGLAAQHVGQPVLVDASRIAATLRAWYPDPLPAVRDAIEALEAALLAGEPTSELEEALQLTVVDAGLTPSPSGQGAVVNHS